MEKRSVVHLAVAHPGSPVLLRASGVLDIATADELTDGVRAHALPGTELVVDISDVTLCDSAGLGAIVRLDRAARAQGCSLTIRSPRRHIAQLLALTGIDKVVKIDSAGAQPA